MKIYSLPTVTAYQNGIDLAVRKIKDGNALPILLTPPPFDIQSFNGGPKPDGKKDYSFNEPYEYYDEALALSEAKQRAAKYLPLIVTAAKHEKGTLNERLSTWNGFLRRDYYVHGRACLLVEPEVPAAGRP